MSYQIMSSQPVKLISIPETIEDKNLYVQNQDIIESIWKKASREKSLFNGTFLKYCSIETHNHEVLVKGSFTEYKNLVANKEHDLGIKPIGVSGITVLKEDSNEYLIFAKRSSIYC